MVSRMITPKRDIMDYPVYSVYISPIYLVTLDVKPERASQKRGSLCYVIILHSHGVRCGI